MPYEPRYVLHDSPVKIAPISDATPSRAGVMSAADKIKLDGIIGGGFLLVPVSVAGDFSAALGYHYEVDATVERNCTLPAATAGRILAVAIAAGAARVNFVGGTVNGDGAAWIQNVNSCVLLLALGGVAWRILGVV